MQPLTLLLADPCREKSAFDCAVEVQSRLELRTQTVEEEATDERPPTDSALRGRGRMSELGLEKLKVEGIRVEDGSGKNSKVAK